MQPRQHRQAAWSFEMRDGPQAAARSWPLPRLGAGPPPQVAYGDSTQLARSQVERKAPRTRAGLRGASIGAASFGGTSFGPSPGDRRTDARHLHVSVGNIVVDRLQAETSPFLRDECGVPADEPDMRESAVLNKKPSAHRVPSYRFAWRHGGY